MQIGSYHRTTIAFFAGKEIEEESFSFGSDSFWLKQIAKQGEERDEFQWFKDRTSLPFECTACGKCCKTDGSVYLTPEEHEQAANFLDISKEAFIQKYASHTISDGGKGEWIRLLERPDANENSHGCIFLNDDNTCKIYEARPIQCSTYPFWPNIMKSRRHWNNEVRRADDETSSDLPEWDVETGGCEGMKMVGTNDDGNIGGVPLDKVYEQIHLYEHDQRRHPNGEEVPVLRTDNIGS